MESSAERKFINLRRRLDQLGYRHPLGIENLPLVEKLFSDLVHTTESLRNAKLSAKSEKESQNCDALLEPYRADNARLVRENNQLHQEVLKLKEEMEHITRDLEKHIRKLDHDISDLKFLNNQYAHKIRCLEKDGKAKTERILQLQEKNLQAVVQTPGGKKHRIAFRRQRMQTDELIPPPVTSRYPAAQPDDPYLADLLQLADNRIVELQDEVTKVKSELDESHECIQVLNNQVGDRDQEIERLNRALHGGRPRDVVSLETQKVNDEKLIAHLNHQIEFLQESNMTLEQKVKGLQDNSSSKVADLSLKNFELCQELTHIDDLAKRMEVDKERALEMADMELRDNKKVIKKQQEAIDDLEKKLKKITAELSERDCEKASLEDQLMELQRQKETLEGTLDFLEAENVRLQDKMDKMMAADKDMVLELEALRAKHGVCGREHSPSRLDAFVKSLEEERDHYRQEAERCRQVSRAGSPVRSPLRSRSPVGKGGGSDMLPLGKERDLLKTALQDVEERMEDIQTNVKALTAERDHFKVMYYQAQEELQDACQRSSTSDDVLNLKTELRLAESKILQVKAERDLLMEEFKVGQTSALPNGHGQEKRIADMQNGIHILEQENLELRSQLFALKESKRDIEQKLDVQSSALLLSAEEAAQHRKTASALRLQEEQMQFSLSDLQHKLSIKTSELHAAREQMEIQDETSAMLRQQVSKYKQEAERLQLSFSALDKEKDGLQDEVDQKAENLVSLQEELKNKAKTLEDLRLRVTTMDKSLAQLQGALNSREREIARLKKQLDETQMVLGGVQKTNELTAKENRRLREDLSTMTRENQTVHEEMDAALRERNELKLRVHSYISAVARVENQLKAKDQEKLDLLERYRTAHLDVEERKHRLQQIEEITNSIRLELLSSEAERQHLHGIVSHKELEIQQYVQALEAYESKVSTLAQTMARLEEELHKAQEEKAGLTSDLASVRELCVKLDADKELTARCLTSKSMELERVNEELEDVRSEAELLKKQLASERLAIQSVEKLLSTNRQKEIQTHLTASEKESELKVLRDRLTLADKKNVEHAREVSNLRTKVSQLQTEMDVLNRQLTSERFERERALQEMRRQGLSISPLRSSSSLNVSTGSQRTSINSSTPQSDN